MKKHNGQIIFFTAAVLMMIAAIWFSMSDFSRVDFYGENSSTDNFVRATVERVREEKISSGQEGMLKGVQELDVKVLSGAHKGETFEVTNTISVSHSVYAKEGQKIILALDYASDDYYTVNVYTYDRTIPMIVIIGAFILLLAGLGGKTGVRSVFGLVFTFVMIIFLMVPLITMGWPPLLTSVSIIVLVGIVSLISLLGFTNKTKAAACGVSMGIALCCLLFFLTSQMLKISGYSMDEIDTLVAVSRYIDIRIKDMLFAGVLIASLGAVMDVAVSVASSICELHEMNPEADWKTLFRAGFRIGRDITGTMANTLILAFTGTFFITLFLCRVYNISAVQLLNQNSIAIEVAQALSATTALALTAPATVFIASIIYGKPAKNN